jgi:hypothetical protein
VRDLAPVHGYTERLTTLLVLCRRDMLLVGVEQRVGSLEDTLHGESSSHKALRRSAS